MVSSVVAPLSFPLQACTSDDVIAKLPNASPSAIANVSTNLFIINASCFWDTKECSSLSPFLPVNCFSVNNIKKDFPPILT